MTLLHKIQLLFFKEQGKPQDNNMDNFEDNDFVLCIQTEFLRGMLQKFGHDTICIDSTHGINMCNFHVITVVVIEEYGEGIPVAWMLSNREDVMAINAFITALKEVCGIITLTWFMSNDADNYINA